MKKLNEIPKAVQERLEFLEFMLRFRGWISRADLTERFSLGEAAATRDIRLYKDFSINNMVLNQKNKKYEISKEEFNPLFNLKIQTVLSKLRTEKICEALGMSDSDGIHCPPRLALPDIDTISAITRAISNGSLLKVQYHAVKSGASEKRLRPHALFDSGLNWYMKAYDIKKEKFRSYALTRILKASIDTEGPCDLDIKSKDFQWNRMVLLTLIPHPNRKNVRCPESIMHDYKMVDGQLNLMVRATLAGYWLHLWNVDCTEKHSLKGYNYQLWLCNHQTLYDVESRMIAPGLSTYEEDQ